LRCTLLFALPLLLSAAGCEPKDGRAAVTSEAAPTRASHAGSGAGCFTLGSDDPVVGHNLDACDAGNGAGCFNLGRAYQDGTGVATDPACAITFFERGCRVAVQPACNSLGVAYDNGLCVAVDHEPARAIYERACNASYGFACTNLGVHFDDGKHGVPVDYQRARVLHERACDLGEPLGCGNLGGLYYNGHGVAKDDAKAFALFTRA